LSGTPDPCLPSALFVAYLLVFEQHAGHLIKYPSGEHLNKAPPISPNPPDVAVISMIVSHPHIEQLAFNTIVDFSGLPSNIFLNISIIMQYIQVQFFAFTIFTRIVWLIFSNSAGEIPFIPNLKAKGG
jgi:hypothetical protein